MVTEEDTSNNIISRLNLRHGHDHSTMQPAILKGRLVAPPVSGLDYRTATQRGITNGNGEFRYQQGERVTFFIGDVHLPTASAGRAVTLYDMGISLHEAINAARLLQSLAKEHNGTLTIPASVARWAKGAINFNVDPIAFAQQPVVASMVNHLGCQLIDAKTAAALLDAMIARYIQGSYLDSAYKAGNTPLSSAYALSRKDGRGATSLTCKVTAV